MLVFYIILKHFLIVNISYIPTKKFFLLGPGVFFKSSLEFNLLILYIHVCMGRLVFTFLKIFIIEIWCYGDTSLAK